MTIISVSNGDRVLKQAPNTQMAQKEERKKERVSFN